MVPMQSRFLLWSLSFPARETKKKKIELLAFVVKCSNYSYIPQTIEKQVLEFLTKRSSLFLRNCAKSYTFFFLHLEYKLNCLAILYGCQTLSFLLHYCRFFHITVIPFALSSFLLYYCQSFCNVIVSFLLYQCHSFEILPFLPNYCHFKYLPFLRVSKIYEVNASTTITGRETSQARKFFMYIRYLRKGKMKS